MSLATLAFPNATSPARRLQSGHVFANKAALLVARNAWLSDPTAAAATYGAIGTWDTSRIRDLSHVFCGSTGWPSLAHADCNTACQSFNDDISGWDVSNVVSLRVSLRATSAPSPPLASPPSPRASERSPRVPSPSPHPQCTFNNAHAFNQPLNNWNTARVTDMQVLRSRVTSRLATLAP